MLSIRICPSCGKRKFATTPPATTITNGGANDQSQVSNSTNKRNKAAGGNYHPWKRLFARSFDVIALSVLVGTITIIVSVLILSNTQLVEIYKPSLNKLIFFIASYLLVLLLEAVFLTTVGTTPGKWTFGISVKTVNGENLSFEQALKRTFLVWLQGQALGIPIVSIIPQIFAYLRLTKTGTTLWDTTTNSVVIHKGWGWGRVIVGTVSIFICFVFLSPLEKI